MTIVFATTFVLLAVAAGCVTARLARGPRTLDRILAVDVLVVLIVAGVAVEMAMSSRGTNIALLLTVALLGFISSVSAVRLAENRREHR